MDKLTEIFELQKELNQRIGVDSDVIKGSSEDQIKWIQKYSLALAQENAELIDSLPWKWWAKYQEFDIQNARVEVVDMLHFLVSIAQVLDMDADDVHELYTKKHAVNHQRQDSGYETKDKSDTKSL